MTNEPSGIQVSANCPLWAFVWRFFSVSIVIDGTVHKAQWGTHFYEVPPGRHTVKVYFYTPVIAESGAKSIEVVVEPGKVTRVSYVVPKTALSAGKLQVEGIETAVPAAGVTVAAAATASSNPGCDKCGQALTPGARFCSACGAPVPQARACNSCGYIQSAGRFCSQCGSQIAS